MISSADLRADTPTWCPGCGDFAVLAALQRALPLLGVPRENIVIVSGIGCSGKISSYLRAYGFHGVHGRTLPVATGIKTANPDLLVIAAGGDGDGYAIGVSHFIHAARRNIDVTYIVMDNHIYGLTTGQTSPTSPRGFKSKTTPAGAAEEPVDPLALALASGAGFVAQGFSGEIGQLASICEQALRYRGFALVNVLSPCVSFNREYSYDWLREHLVDIDHEPGYDPHDYATAVRYVTEHHGLLRGAVYVSDRPGYVESLVGTRRPVDVDWEEPKARWPELVAEFN